MASEPKNQIDPESDKPCPFCGAFKKSMKGVRGFGVSLVQCDNCLATGPQKATEADAIIAWNNRTKTSIK